ncbi:hypothetical protein ALC62_05869 [Cyphomyrmex costatus]|uniref:BED-type domain-containing protein n=1 Tax=Cyphomyrmex costatus TaxID=456900 RepID=A0A151IJ94_9HYME|nr:hypothetical protein ALC62_05869 [Cyphomyrmex costatus]
MDKEKNTFKSVVWKYFKKKDSISAICILCRKILKHGGNTTNLKQHLQRKHIFYLQHDDLSENYETIDEDADKNIENVDINDNAINFIDTHSDDSDINKTKDVTKKYTKKNI